MDKMQRCSFVFSIKSFAFLHGILHLHKKRIQVKNNVFIWKNKVLTFFIHLLTQLFQYLLGDNPCIRPVRGWGLPRETNYHIPQETTDHYNVTRVTSNSPLFWTPQIQSLANLASSNLNIYPKFDLFSPSLPSYLKHHLYL